MKTANTLWMGAPASTIYRLAAEVERWPEILPHYRWVTVLEREGNRKLVEMAATRDGFPVKWQALQVLEPDAPRIRFTHVRGVTKGMEVEWSFHEQDGGTLVRIDHALDLAWPIVGPWVAEHIIGPQFVANIAGKTLRYIKVLSEQSATTEERRTSHTLRDEPAHYGTPSAGAQL
ncbi:MAG TPA: SRPBCC family protein [Chloroflexota bacterium]|nr:SRPBCC family protein [Chloroflexota bacterium]